MKNKKQQMIEDEKKVKRMIATWDIVRCKICGQKTSMLEAKPVNGGEYFVCRFCQ